MKRNTTPVTEKPSSDEPLVKPYDHKPRIVPDGMEVFECCLINGKVRKAEWHEVKLKQTKVKRAYIGLLRWLRNAPKPKPIQQLVENEDCIYLPAQNITVAKAKFDRMLRMSKGAK